VEPVEKRPLIELNCFRESPALQGFLEGDGIAPNASWIEANVHRSPAQEDIRTEVGPQEVKGLVERVAGALFREFRPEERQQGVPPVEASRLGDL
jgi:hypothetical protein